MYTGYHIPAGAEGAGRRKGFQNPDRGERGRGRKTFYIEANVEGSSGENYYVWLRFNLEEDAIEDYECECEACHNYDGMCKHCGAVALKYLRQVRANTRMSSYRQSVQQTAKVHSDPQILELMREYDMRRRQSAQADERKY